MRLDERQARARFGDQRVARLATVTPEGRPHIVPIVFALDGDTLYTAVDAKPKSTTALRRLANIAAHPAVAVLADVYEDDWSQLWWVRADGTAQVAADDAGRHGIELLTARYPVYETQPPPGPVLTLEITRWSGWSAGPG
ncbi:TIGR03668 family PPOX class F420-dependent oxidoreductase [Nocardia sp. NPDC024068]|uniref:TIGR03668 family PPOX class F420-dependent oxidoreductase n=1 Tax=Nocardia sp. NPDC024068 TaxID=3157197 RepID=UPI0033DB8D27